MTSTRHFGGKRFVRVCFELDYDFCWEKSSQSLFSSRTGFLLENALSWSGLTTTRLFAGKRLVGVFFDVDEAFWWEKPIHGAY